MCSLCVDTCTDAVGGQFCVILIKLDMKFCIKLFSGEFQKIMLREQKCWEIVPEISFELKIWYFFYSYDDGVRASRHIYQVILSTNDCEDRKRSPSVCFTPLGFEPKLRGTCLRYFLDKEYHFSGSQIED